MSRVVVLFLLAFQAVASSSIALPQRLVIALDGIAYRDMTALQSGVNFTNILGGIVHQQAFSSSEGYFPVSRLISTFPSISDIAWTDILGDRPTPGYQRTYFSAAGNSQISFNGVATTLEHERQMDWQVESSFVRSMGYIYSAHVFKYEVQEMVKNFWNTRSTNASYYAYIRSSDDAQHLNRNIFSLLCQFDKQLQDLRARYQAREGHDLQIIILADHGHNHAGAGQRVKIRTFLENAGYRIAQSIVSPKDVVLPVAGIEDWVEIHNAPSETEPLAKRLSQLKGVDVLAARIPEQPNRFLVLNSKDGRAVIDWNPSKNTFRYTAGEDDPLNYRPVISALARKNQLDADGFATADDWMTETMTNHYPLALERIVRGFTSAALNPATILISLDNQYVNAGWLVKEGSRLENYGSTHGALDDINSDGIVLCNFKPTRDTSSERVGRQFDDFPGLQNYRAVENGAEWVTKSEQGLVRIARDPFDRDYKTLPADDIFLRIWSPFLTRRDSQIPIEVTIEKIPRFAAPQIERGNRSLANPPGMHLTFDEPVSFPEQCSYERVYSCPTNLVLDAQAEYRILGSVRDREKNIRIFEFIFFTDNHGRPTAF